MRRSRGPRFRYVLKLGRLGRRGNLRGGAVQEIIVAHGGSPRDPRQQCWRDICCAQGGVQPMMGPVMQYNRS